MLKQVQLALAALLLTGALSAPSAAQPTAASDQCGEYYGCIVYGPWPPPTR